ncbi:MAG: SgcJ/EcaC family oxidoreductase [Pirellulales bacterium]
MTLASLIRTARHLVAAGGIASALLASHAAAAQAVAAPTALDKAIRAEAEATVKAFNAADAAALAGLFSPTGELVDENGNVFTGTESITTLFKTFFEKFPKAVLDMEVTSTRPLGTDIAVEEGVRRITANEGASAAQVRYVVVREKAGDRWPIASYREFADDPAPTPREMLMALEWLVGEWIDESPEARTSISFRWSDDGNFLLGDYSVAVGGETIAASTQRIGWDPIEGRLRSWTFDSDGGFTEGKWLAGDDEWIVRSEATMPDGTSGSATMTVKLQDADHFVIESTDRVVAGAEEPDFKLVVARKPPAPASTR